MGERSLEFRVMWFMSRGEKEGVKWRSHLEKYKGKNKLLNKNGINEAGVT